MNLMLKKTIPKNRSIAYTTDVWKSSSRDQFICLTAHLLDDHLKPVSILLAFRRLKNRTLSKNLNQFISYELNRFGLTESPHAGITTDSGSDIKAATDTGQFGQRIPCVAHTLNLIIKHGTALWDKPSVNR